MHDKRFRWVLLLTAGILIVLLIWSILRTPAPPPVVGVTQAAQEEVYNSISVKGTVRALRESQEYVYAPARVEQCYVSLGDTVEVGQALLRVSYPQVTERAEQAVAAFFEEAANLSAEQEGPIVRASMNGTVAQLPEVGTLLIPGVAAVRIGDFSQLEVEAKVPELYAGDLTVGQQANITPIVERAQTISARLSEIAPYAVQTFSLTGGTQSAMIRCNLEITDPDVKLMPGTTVDVKLFTDMVPNAITVPYTAVRQDGDQQYVYRCESDGTVVRQNIETGYQLSQGVQVIMGLSAGDWIVNDTQTQLHDGQKVTFDADV